MDSATRISPVSATKSIWKLLPLLLTGGVGSYFYLRQKLRAAPNQLVVHNLPAACAFVWHANATTSPVEPQACLLVPVTLPNCPLTCYLQFDTGARSSLLYARPLAALRALYPATGPALLPADNVIRRFSCALGSALVQARDVQVLQYGDDQVPDDAREPFIIGTLGADVLESGVLVLDYARGLFQLLPRLPDALARDAVFTPLDFTNRRVMLGATLVGNPQQLLFDSGSSAYALITDWSSWRKLASAGAPVESSPVNSWGKYLTAHTVATAAQVEFGAAAVPLHTVTFIQGIKWWHTALMLLSGVEGMLGNKAFRQHAIILDVSNRLFGLVVSK